MPTPRPSTPLSSQPEPAKGLTPQQRQMIGIGALVACLLIGGGIVYWLLFSGPKRRTITVDPTEQTADVGGRPILRMQPPRRPPVAIFKQNDTSWMARGMTGALMVHQEAGGDYKLTAYYLGRDFLQPDQVALVSALVRARNDEAMAREWGITPEQLAQLKKVQLGGSAIQMSSGERDELRQLWDAYIKAAEGTAKSDAEKKVIARLDEIAKANMDASRKAYVQRLDEIKQILTPEQVDKMSKR